MDVGDIKLVESDCQDWIEAVTGSYFQEDSFRESLQDGVLLCKLLNAVEQGAVNKVNTRSGTFAHMENLNAFIAGCKSLGIPHSALFAPSDIQAPAATKRRQSQLEAQRRADDKRVRNVLVTLYWLNQKAVSSPGYYGPELATEHFSQLMKDPWASPANAASKVKRPSLPGVSSERLADNEMTGLRRATLAVSPTSERPASPMDRPRSLLVEESCQKTSQAPLLSTTSSGGGSSNLGTSPMHSFSSPSPSSQSGDSVRSSTSGAAPTTRRLSTGETLVFSPRQLALQAALELTEDPLDSVPEDRPSTGYHSAQTSTSSSSSSSSSRYAKPQSTSSHRSHSSNGTAVPRSASTSSAVQQNASNSTAAPRNTSKEIVTTDSVPSSRKRSDSGVAFLASPVMMTITASAAGDSDGNEEPVRAAPASMRTARDQPKRFTAATSYNAQSFKSASLPRQQAPATSFYPTPPPDSSKSPSPDYTSPPPSRGSASSQRSETSQPPARQWHRKSPEAPPTEPSVPWQSSKRQQQHQQQFAPTPLAPSQVEQRSSGISSVSAAHTDKPAAATLPRSFGSTSSQATSDFSHMDVRSKGPPPPPKRDAAAETKRSQIYAALGRPSPPQSVSPATARPTDQPGTVTSTATITATSTMTITVTSKDSTQEYDQPYGDTDIRDQIMADLADFTASPERIPSPSLPSPPPEVMMETALPPPPPPPPEVAVQTASLESTASDSVLPAVTQPPALAAPAASARKPSVSKSFSFSGGSDTQRLMAEEQKWRSTRRRSELAKQVDMLLDDNSLVKSLSQPLSAPPASASHNGSEAFLDAAASDARVQEQQQLKWLQSISAQPVPPPIPAVQRPASAAGYLHDDYLRTAEGKRQQDLVQSPASELSSYRQSPLVVGSPASPLDLSTGIDKDRSEMERLLALANEERSQQLAAAEEHRRMSLDQQEDMTKKKREKAMRTLASERRKRNEQEREQRWTRVEEERRRQLREEEEDEARALDGYLSGTRAGGSQEAIAGQEDVTDGVGDIDEALALEIENEAIWEELPTRSRSEDTHVVDVSALRAMAEGETEEHASQSSVPEVTTPHISVSHDADEDEDNDCISGSYSADPESQPVKKLTSVLSESSIADILDPLASAIESVSMDKSEKRRSITKFQTSSIVVSPLRSPRTIRSSLAGHGALPTRHASGSSLGRTSPPSRPGSSNSSITGRASPLARQSSGGSLLEKTSPPARHISDSSLGEELPPPAKTDSIVESTLSINPFLGRPLPEAPPHTEEPSPPAKPPRPSGLVETNLPSPNLPIANGFGHSNMSRFFSSAVADFGDDTEDQTDSFEPTTSEFVSGGVATDV